MELHELLVCSVQHGCALTSDRLQTYIEPHAAIVKVATTVLLASLLFVLF
ncbi:MAG: hypothetical protein JJU00_17280 [Opitutales bacterium]|nr:hypothetical protein [Opitutales bacterium]